MRSAIGVLEPEDYVRDRLKLTRAVAYQGGLAMLDAFLAMSEGAMMPVPPEVPDELAASWWPSQQAACQSLVESLVSPDAFERPLVNQPRRPQVAALARAPAMA